MPVARFVVGLFLTLLPERWRGRILPDIDLVRSAVVSTSVLIVLCLGLLIFRYIFFFQARIGDIGGAAIASGADEALGSRAVQYGMGTVVLLEYLIQPVSLLLIYFAIESAGRLVAAIVTGEVVPTLPLQAVEWTRRKIKREQVKRELGAPILDLVQAGTGEEYELRIASCRRKPNWNQLMTVSYQDELYEIVREEKAAKPRPWVYLLRKKPEGKVVRGLHHYSPDEEVVKAEVSGLPEVQNL